MKTGNYIIGSITNDGYVCFSTIPVQHLDAPTAMKEAERLTTQYPHKKFMVCQIVGICKQTNIS